jgi:hypothetical protein
LDGGGCVYVYCCVFSLVLVYSPMPDMTIATGHHECSVHHAIERCLGTRVIRYRGKVGSCPSAWSLVLSLSGNKVPAKNSIGHCSACPVSPKISTR